MDEEVIISPQVGEGMMQIDIESLAKDPDFVQDNDNDNDNQVKGELLDSIASECEPDTAAGLEPYEGMEFESEEAARAFYGAYARHVGFRVRISRYTRSRRDNSIISRLIVCSKEGFREPRGVGERKQQRQRAVTRVGCKAMLMVKKLADGKWVVSRFVKEHNHGPVPPRKPEVWVVRKEEDSAAAAAAEAEEPCAALTDGGEVREPFEGMEFDSEEEARGFYINYARKLGFRARISKYCRSRRDNSIISRQIVCSKEGFREVRIKKEDADDGRVKRPRVVTRIGCKAMIVVKKVSGGKWAVSRFEKEHNHALGTSKKDPLLLQSSNVGGDDVLCNGAMVMSGERCDGTPGAPRESLADLYDRLCCEAIKFAQEGAVSEEIYNVAMSALKEAVEKVAAAKQSAAAVAQGVNGGHGSCITKCSNEAMKAVSGNNLVVVQQPVEFVLIPSSSLANDSKPANHSVESPMVINIPNGQGIGIPNPISVLKQSSPNTQSVKGLVGNGTNEHMGAVQSSQKLDDIGVSQLKATGGNGSSLAGAGASEAHMATFPALPVTLYMPVMGSSSESCSGIAGSNAYTLVAAPVEGSPVTTGPPSQVDVQQSTTPMKGQKDQSPWSYTGPNPQVHATAIAAGARIIPPLEAASLIRAIEARVRNSKPAFGSGCLQLSASVAQNPLSRNNSEAGPKPQRPAHAHSEAIGGQVQASSEEMRFHEPGEGFKEMDVAMMDHSAVYDGACDDHLFSDAGS